MTVNSVTAALFTWHALKLSWQQRISDHKLDSLLPTHWKTILLNSAKLLSIHITNEIFGLSAVKTTPSLARLVRDTWEWNGPFLHVCRHIMLTRKNSRRVTSPASHHGFAKSIISSDSWVVFYSFSFRDNFYLESHSTRRAACFWHDENNSDKRDTRLKRLSGYSNWEYCCVSAVA